MVRTRPIGQGGRMQFPGPVRAVLGLLATAAEEAKPLPDRAVELPMLAVSTALQISLRAQQRYARLAARGDEVLHRRPPSDEPPPWATFDEPVSMDEVRRGSLTAEQAHAASELLDELLGVRASEAVGDAGGDGQAAASDNGRAKRTPARKPAVKKAPAKKAPAKKAPAKKAAAKKPATNEPAAGESAPLGKSV